MAKLKLCSEKGDFRELKYKEDQNVLDKVKLLDL
jgi:hypothetical protein